MIIFHVDLDNTLIYSYKREIGDEKIGVEEYQERTISYMTLKSYRRLREISRRVLLIPTTTRTAEQYNRIDLGIGTPRYALVCNGGVLLEDGVEDTAWYEESLRLTENCRMELEKAQRHLLNDKNRSFEVRNIRDLFVFTKSERPKRTTELLRASLDLSLVDVFENGAKVYVIPKILHKGCAVKRMKERLMAGALAGVAGSKESGTSSGLWIAAGDSAFDVPMADEADIFLAPDDAKKRETELFSDFVTRYVLLL